MVGSGAGGADGLRDSTNLNRATCREREGREIGAKGARMERMGKEVKGIPGMAHRLAPIYMQVEGEEGGDAKGEEGGDAWHMSRLQNVEEGVREGRDSGPSPVGMGIPSDR